MSVTFVQNGNQSIAVSINARGKIVEERNLEWFTAALHERKVCGLHIVWNAQEHFNEIPPHLMDDYLHFRDDRKGGGHKLHADALKAAEIAYEQKVFGTI